jgi:tRNA dimethylallyltransferase
MVPKEKSKTLVVIAGPTAIGKTNVSIALASYFCTEIVSCDSRQVYREMTIGTAIPSPEELKKIPHHFIHSHSVYDALNASNYESEAIALIERLFEKNNILILTGGSMLYIDAVCKGIDFMPDADPEIRESLKNTLKNEGLESLRLQLKQLDPDYYTTVDLKNPARILHAVEICLTTGKPFSSFLTNSRKNRNFRILKIVLDCPREELHRTINTRVDKMIAMGLEEEAGSLYHIKHLTPLNTVGYKEMFAYFDGEITLSVAIERIKRNTRRYARKQLSWFRNDKLYRWFYPSDITGIINFIKTETVKT